MGLLNKDNGGMVSTAKNYPGNEKIYIPPVWRLLLIHLVLPIIATLIGWFSRFLIDIWRGGVQNGLEGLDVIQNTVIVWAIISILLVGFNRDWFAIGINDASISGQAPLGGRVVLLLSEIDMRKTSQRTAVDRLFKVWKVWDIRRNKVIINGYYFQDDQMSEILHTLGLEDQ
jgi:hypothetical protein